MTFIHPYEGIEKIVKNPSSLTLLTKLLIKETFSQSLKKSKFPFNKFFYLNLLIIKSLK